MSSLMMMEAKIRKIQCLIGGAHNFVRSRLDEFEFPAFLSDKIRPSETGL